jgi:hypothetical protein
MIYTSSFLTPKEIACVAIHLVHLFIRFPVAKGRSDSGTLVKSWSLRVGGMGIKCIVNIGKNISILVKVPQVSYMAHGPLVEIRLKLYVTVNIIVRLSTRAE